MPGAMMPEIRGGDGTADGSDQIYISIPEDKWDEFARDFSVQVYNNKADYKRNSLILFRLIGPSWRCSYLFYQWPCTSAHS